MTSEITFDGKVLKIDKANIEVNYLGVRLNMYNKDKHMDDIGFIAQDVEEVIPEVVFTNSEGYKTLHYNKLVTVAIGSIQEQQTRINMMIEKLDFLLKVVE